MYADNDTIALATLALFEDRRRSALSCVGLDDPEAPDAMERAAELEDGMDDDERENYGAAVAWTDAIDLLRTAFTLGTVEGHVGDISSCATKMLEALADVEGAGSDLYDAAKNAAALVGSVDTRSDVEAGELLDCAAQAIERAGMVRGMGDSLLFPLRMEGDHRDHCTLREVGQLVKQAADQPGVR